MFELEGKYNKATIFTDNVDNETISQVMGICNQEWTKDSKIAIMPDCHAGKGCVIGTTMTLHGKVCPNLVGVDIGCGMLTVKLSKLLNNLSLEKLDEFINNNIPSGFDINEKRVYNPNSENLHLEELRCYNRLKNVNALENAIGSLGGGNHFLELDKDNEENIYLVIHTGSRNLGKQVADYYQEVAYEDCNKQKEIKMNLLNELIEKLKSEGRQKEIQEAIQKFNQEHKPETKIKKELCYLEGNHLDDYLHDMYICQHFAKVNRKFIALRILEHLFKEKFGDSVGNIYFNINKGCVYKCKNISIDIEMFETVHNYINPYDNILRKGAISAQEGELVLIPINMRDGAIIGVGKGNEDWNYSGPHGAGRIMSRGEAKEFVSLEEFKESMKNIYSSSVMSSTIDESPMAYKPIEEILKNIKDSIEILKIIKPIYNFKAH